MANVTIIQLPTNLGLKEPNPGHEPGVKKLPDWLRKHGFHDRINACAIFRLDPPPYSMQLDVLNDDIMSAVDSREKDGLSYAELDQILQPLLSHPRAIGIEITILDPELDPTGEITQAFVDAFCKSFNTARRT